MNKAFLNKDHQELPDKYGMTLTFINGKSESFEVASHAILKDLGVLEIVTFNDEWKFFPVTNIQSVCFDKQWSKIVSLKQELNKKAEG